MRVTFGANAWSFVFDFGRPITLLSPINMPGTHQYAVTLVAQIVAQVLGLFWRSLLVDKVSWYMRFFLILPNKYYTFVTSPVLSASPSPAPFCSIFGGPNRLDLWLDLCLKLLFDCQKLEGYCISLSLQHFTPCRNSRTLLSDSHPCGQGPWFHRITTVPIE